MDFYTNPLSPNCRKAVSVAIQLDIELNTKVLDLTKGENKTPEYLAINPNGLVPALVDGDVRLWESNAIQCYLASKTNNDLWPKNNLRYDIIRWQSWELAHFGSMARELIFQRLLKPMFGLGGPDAERCEEIDTRFAKYAKVLDDHLSRSMFLVNNQLTIADFCVASSLTYKDPAKLPIGTSKNILRWLQALDDQPGWRGSAPPPM